MPKATPRYYLGKEIHDIIRLSGMVRFTEEAAGTGDGNGPVWVQIAKTQECRGHSHPFELKTEHFEQMVANLRRHPSFQAGPDGMGEVAVIPWDFEHLSDPALYDEHTPVVGAPAQGWIQDLKVVTNADGTGELWALTSWLDLARTYIKGGQYKSASIDFTFNGTDPVSGESVGATLISVALTNEPFIQGMQPLAAKKTGGTVRADWWEAADNAEEALRDIKRALKLPETADVAVLSAELAKLRQWVTAGGAPVGVDIQNICGTMRTILNLPALSTEVEVLDEADKLVTRILEEQSIQSGQPPAPADGQELNIAMVAGGRQMEFPKILARMLSVREDADESVIKAAVEDLVKLRSGVKQALAADKDTTTVLLEAANEVVSLRKTGEERFVALKEALGTKGNDDPTSRITVLLKAEKELDELRPKYEALAKVAEEQENAKAEEDVTLALRQHGLPDNAKAALLNYRKSDPKKFAEEFPLAPPEHEHLTMQLTTGTRAAESSGAGGNSVGDVINLNKYSGANETEKLASYIQDTNPEAKNWSRERLFREVNALRNAQEGR